MASFADAALLQLEGFGGQAAVAVAFAGFWAALIEYIRWPMHRRVLSAAWWPRALPAQLNIMANFGYDRDATTADMAAHGFVWVLTMCLTHVVSAALMAPVVALGWDAAGALGRLLFFVGTLSEVGFDVYDTIKSFLLTFFQHAVPQLGPAAPLKPFILICVLHHSTVLAMAVPMNLYYPDLAAYHQMAFSLLVSAGVCYLAGQYKFTLDAKCPSDLLLIKMIMVLQFAVNWLTRVFMWFPAVYSTLLLLWQGQPWLLRGRRLRRAGHELV
eukprot:SRR837773.17456.p2 GENE.SRR837773.17456~~SRR837773.17456.p2  ORF type:complete len:271 (+),score=95.41 SRR837773.17456:48-860(+)